MSWWTRESVSNRATEVSRRPSGRILWERFCQDRYALFGAGLVLLLFAVAIYAPLLANNKPLLIERDGVRDSPLLRDIFAPSDSPELMLERSFNYLMLLATAAGILLTPLWLLVRLHSRAAAWRAVRIGLVLLGLALLVQFLTIRSRLDKTDYRQLVAEGRGEAVFALMAPVPYGPFEQPATSFQAPGPKHWLGTDKVGRDVLARLIHGSRVSLSVGFVAVALYVVIGVVIGALAAYLGGWVDLVVQRFVEVVICFPTFLLILTIMAFVEHRSIFNVVLVMGLTGWTAVARLVRGEVLKQKQLDYVSAATALGAGRLQIVFKHILPNAMAPVLVAATFGVAGAILTETSLSFLGFGVRAPTASWGELLNQAQLWPSGYWWLTAWPGMMIFVTVTTFNLVGEGFRDALDPRQTS